MEKGGGVTAFVFMVIVQLGYVGMNIIAKLAMNTGMSPFVEVAYRQLFATLSILPLAYFMERNNRPKMTRGILFQIFLCSISGVSVNQITYFVGLKNSTPTIACALTNINPAVTFIMAVAFRLENIGVKTKSGLAKIAGTVLCVGGALFLSFYSGPVVPIGQSIIHWKFAERSVPSNTHPSLILGPFLLILSAVSWAVYLIIQAKVSKNYNVPYSSTAIMCAMATVQCVAVAFAMEPKLSAWSLNSELRLFSSIYSGVVCSALAFCLMAWCIDRKGPLYVSVFSPLLLVMVAIVSWALLDEKIYVGTVVGSVLIVLGLNGVLWGKNKETDVYEPEKKMAEPGMKMESLPPNPNAFSIVSPLRYP
ncbi:WAT1-related protein At1g09380 [Salvia splendens]|uniref:WAT1-related protein At1g09380 n=1 Tax=Salvia splendens TaxID=180675 RepID=UPI001C270D26|nr:WAT1-related protein At1g09380 [Salvia splendens]